MIELELASLYSGTSNFQAWSYWHQWPVATWQPPTWLAKFWGLVGWSLTSLFSTNTAISETINFGGSKKGAG